MNKKFGIILLITLMFISVLSFSSLNPVSASTVTILNNAGASSGMYVITADSATTEVSYYTWVGEVFKPSQTGYITSLGVLFANSFNQSGNLAYYQCEIFNTISGTYGVDAKATGTPIETSEQIYAPTASATDWTYFTFQGYTELVSGTAYAFRISATYFVGNIHNSYLGMDGASTSFAGNSFAKSFVTGTESTFTSDIKCIIYGSSTQLSPTPTPDTSGIITPHLWTYGTLITSNNNASTVQAHDNWRVSVKGGSGWRFDHFYILGDPNNITASSCQIELNATGLWYTYTFQDITEDNKNFGVVYSPLDGSDPEGSTAILTIHVTGSGSYAVSPTITDLNRQYKVGDYVTITAYPSPNTTLVSIQRNYAYYMNGTGLPNPYYFQIMLMQEDIYLTFTGYNGTSTPTPTPTINNFNPNTLTIFTNIASFFFGANGGLGSGFGLILCAICMGLGYKGAGAWGFFAGLHIGIIICLVAQIFGLWTIIILVLLDALALTGKIPITDNRFGSG